MRLSLKLLAALVFASFCLQASAATFTIADGDVAALITAITTSNSNGEDDTIELATNGTCTLTAVNNGINGLPVIGSDSGHQLVIHGNGATLQRSTAGGTPAFRIFYINSGSTVTISGLTITNGNPAQPNDGGGIYNDHATLTVSNCTVRGNSVMAARGAGIYNNDATLTVTNTTLSGNSGSVGGGIDNDGDSGSATLTITNSTISGNAAGNGGGIANESDESGSATLTITNSTISGNSGINGGGIFNLSLTGSATLTITNSTISGNSVGNFGGPFNSSATLTIADTILNAGSGANISNISGTVTSLGYNLSSDDASALLNQSTDQNSTDPKLGPLQDNGGPTFTHALCTASGVPDASCTGVSPAIDQGKNFTSATTDQRGSGFARTVDFASIPNATGGDGTDIGAFEVQACSTPAAPRALEATNVTASSFTANWSSVSGATGYRLDVCDKDFTNCVYHDFDVGNTTSYNVIGLSAGTTYYYRVRAYNGNCISPNSNVMKVKTNKL